MCLTCVLENLNMQSRRLLCACVRVRASELVSVHARVPACLLLCVDVARVCLYQCFVACVMFVLFSRLEYNSPEIATALDHIDGLFKGGSKLDPTTTMPRVIWKLVGNKEVRPVSCLVSELLIL